MKNRFCVSSGLIISVCTIVLFCLSSAPLYAAERITDAPAVTQEPATSSSTTVETTTTAETTALSATVSAPTEPPTISNEMKVMDINIGVSSNTGAANASIPIEVPPGRKGVAPNLALAYNSNMGNGWIGVGWSLGLGEIQRSTKRGVNYYPNEADDNPDYVFVMNGASSELVKRTDWNYPDDPNAVCYEEKIERTFSKYCRLSSDGWVVTTKDGTKYYYGITAASRQDNAHGVFKWCLDKVQDTNGNFMTVTYWKDVPNGEGRGR